MRPIKLELQGFTAYRELTICDFRGVDLFVVTGPTGSGKSSLIDAMTFALYGSVPRYGNPNLVHPVVSQGKLEAKVRFDFSVEGRVYTAVRIVRRTRGGATTREARLESEGRTLAGNADEVSARVREILGLDFTQFTTCVVLPQGEFARFLHDTPADRQDLLTKLLGVGIYEKAGNLARIREAEATQKATLHREELERLGALTEASRAAARTRVCALETLRKAIESEEPAIEELGRRAWELRERSKQIEREKLLLENIPAVPDTAQLSERIAAAREELAAARRASVEAESELTSAESAASRLPAAATIRELSERARRLPDAERESEGAERALARAHEERSAAASEEERARRFLEETRRKLAAHDLRGHLAKGERCPVCLRAIERMPRGELPPALSDAEKSLAKAAKGKARADKAWQDASQRAALAAEKRKELRAGVETSKDLLAQTDIVAAAEARLAEARARAKRSRDREREAGGALERLSSLERTAFQSFEEARDRVASLGPPRSHREDLRASWIELAEWAGKERGARIEAAGAALKAAEEAEAEQRK
ncbi:MAG TPA: SMC family ATPase, partial [Vicinamibacteria bacterium]